MYDVGQRINTPRGTGIVLAYRLDTEVVLTDIGTFNAEDTSAYLDREALKDPEVLESWIDSDDEPPNSRIAAQSWRCACKCGNDGHCHHLVHVDDTGALLQRFPHVTITTACHCLERDCVCLD